MVFILIFALLSTLIYFNLVISDAINARTGGIVRTAEEAKTLSKVKYWLIFFMSILWGVYIRFC